MLVNLFFLFGSCTLRKNSLRKWYFFDVEQASSTGKGVLEGVKQEKSQDDPGCGWEICD